MTRLTIPIAGRIFPKDKGVQGKSGKIKADMNVATEMINGELAMVSNVSNQSIPPTARSPDKAINQIVAEKMAKESNKLREEKLLQFNSMFK